MQSERRFRFALGAGALWFCALGPGTVSAAPKPLECPTGTALVREQGNRGDRLEICKDTKSGAQHGPARLYDDHDKVIMEMTNDMGRETSRAFTPAGIARYIKDVNEAKKLSKRPMQYEIANAQTLRYIVTAEPDGATLDEQRVHASIRNEEPCLLMQLPGATFEKIEMRLQRPGGKVWFKTEIAREECARR
jgi:hypothetical protein